MPKEQLALKQFEGGLMEYHDPRDIPENALSKADDVMVDKIGTVRSMGRQQPHPTIGNINSTAEENIIQANFNAGYGLHRFGSDYQITENSGQTLVTAVVADPITTFTLAGHNFVVGDRIKVEGSSIYGEYVISAITSTTFVVPNATAIGSAERFYVSRVVNDGVLNNMYAVMNGEKVGIIDRYLVRDQIDMGSDAVNVKPVFYNVADALRVSDGNFSNTGNSTRWYGYIPERTQFIGHAEATASWAENTNSSYDYDTFTADDADTIAEAVHSSGEATLNSADDFALRDGVTVKITLDLTLNSGANPLIYLALDADALPSASKSEVKTLSNGSNTIYLTPRALHSNNYATGCVCLYTNGATNYTFDNFVLTHVSYIPSGWYDESQEIAAPISTTFISKDADLDLSGDVSVHASRLQVYQVGIQKDNGLEGEFSGADFTKFVVGMSYLYIDGQDGVQESRIYEDEDEDITLDTNGCGLDATVQSPNYSDSINESLYIDHRIIGARVYLTKQGADATTLKSVESPLLLIEIDNIKGARWWNGDWVAWTADGTNAYVAEVDLRNLEAYPMITYKAISSYEHNVNTLKAEYKTACIANNRTYIGNVYQADVDDQSSTVTYKNYGDRIIKSPYRKYDVFPSDSNFYLNIVPGDGDEIVKLLEFSNRLLVFKHNTMYLVNIAEDTEIIESTHKNAGIDFPYSVTETPYGPVWVNQSGCFFYSKEGLVNLIENKIDSENWRGFVSDSSIGYIPYKKQIVVTSTPQNIMNSTTTDDVYIFDFQTQSWTKGINKLLKPSTRSNMVSSHDGNMIWAYIRPFDETVTVFDTTAAGGAYATGSFSWTGGTLTASSYLFIRLDSDDSYRRISEEITNVAISDQESIMEAIVSAINIGGTFNAYGSSTGAAASITVTAKDLGTTYNGKTGSVDGNDVGFILSTVIGFDDSPDAEGSAPYCGLTGTNFGEYPDAGVAAGYQVTPLIFNRVGSTTASVEWRILIVWYSLLDANDVNYPEGYTIANYTTGSDDDAALATGIKAALDATTYDNGIEFLTRATCTVNDPSDGYLTITARDANKAFVVGATILSGSAEGGAAIGRFNNDMTTEALPLNLDFQTRDIDFGTPGVRKKVYKVYLTYKLRAGKLYPQYAIDGSTTFRDFDDVALDNSTGWTTVALVPATKSQANNIYSFKFRLKPNSTSTSVKGFLINDITIVYRIKSIK